MATTSKTYLPTDWKIWTYAPEPGVFRWDFSQWDDGSDWGATGDGSMAEVTGKIAEIVIEDGHRAEDGFTFELQPANATVSLVYDTFDKDVLKEFYNGKRVVITFANPSTSGGVFGSYGKNTVMFEGFITSSSVSLDPISQITTVDFSATDFVSMKLNTPVNEIRNTAVTKYAQILASSWYTAENTAQTNIYTDSQWGINLVPLGSFNPAPFSNVSQPSTIGQILKDFSISYLAYAYSAWNYSTIGSGYWRRSTTLKTLDVLGTSTFDVDADRITAVTLGNDATNNPNSFTFNNFDGTAYQFGTAIENSLSGNVNINLTVDFTSTTSMQDIVDKFITYRSRFRPITVDVEIARTYQPLGYTNTSGGEFLVPDNVLRNGSVGRFDLTSYGYTLDETKSLVIGQTHTINADTWICTYELMKGL